MILEERDMITIYKSIDSRLATISEPAPGCWINATNPSSTEINHLCSLGIPADYLTYPLDVDERARTEREQGDLLIVLRVPDFQGIQSDVPYTTLPLGIILSGDYLVTVCKRDNPILMDFASGKVRNLNTAKRQRFILKLLLATANKFLAYLREITKVVDALEDQLQRSTRNREVLELLKYQKSLTYFTTALKSNELMMERLHRSRLFNAFPEDEDLLEDVITENQQAIEMTNIQSNILSSMMDAFASIISNNLNSVMKFLASITIVLSLPTMIASFYGMNVALPLMDHPMAFWLTLLLTGLITIPVIFFFRKQDWF
jgi:magnesium transporter